MITTAAPSPTGAQSCARSGSATYGRPSSSEAATEPDTCASGLDSAAARLRTATSAMSFSVHRPASIPSRACRAATDTESSHSGASRYGSSCRASTRRSSAPDDLPNPYASAISASPVRTFTQASYSAHAPSISTCDSIVGGTAPMASTADTNENARPAR